MPNKAILPFRSNVPTPLPAITQQHGRARAVAGVRVGLGDRPRPPLPNGTGRGSGQAQAGQVSARVVAVAPFLHFLHFLRPPAIVKLEGQEGGGERRADGRRIPHPRRILCVPHKCPFTGMMMDAVATLEIGSPSQKLSVLVDTGSSNTAVPVRACALCGAGAIMLPGTWTLFNNM
jgi:hypothetical protein